MNQAMLVFFILFGILHFGVALQDHNIITKDGGDAFQVPTGDQSLATTTPDPNTSSPQATDDIHGKRSDGQDNTWKWLSDKTQFNWLQSQEYKDVNEFMAHSDKYLDVDYVLNRAGKYNNDNVLLQRILSNHPQHGRKKRSVASKTDRRRMRKDKHSHKNGKHGRRSKTRANEKGQSHNSPFTRKHPEKGLELDTNEMDKMVMSLTLGRLTEKHDGDHRGKNKSTGVVKSKSNHKDKSQSHTQDLLHPERNANQHMVQGETDQEERDIATPFTVEYVTTIVNMLKTSMNLLLLKSGEDFVVNPNTPKDDIGGVWLDTAPMHDDVRLAPEAHNEHKRRRRSAPLQDGGTRNHPQDHDIITKDGDALQVPTGVQSLVTTTPDPNSNISPPATDIHGKRSDGQDNNTWQWLSDKTQFNWLQSQEYKDVNDLMAHSDKYLDVDYVLNRAGKDNNDNVLLQRILSNTNHQHGRKKRSVVSKTDRRRMRKDKHSHKNGKHGRRSKTRANEKGQSHNSHFARKHQEKELDLDTNEMDKMVMSLTLGRLTEKHDGDHKGKNKSTGVVKKSNHKNKSQSHTQDVLHQERNVNQHMVQGETDQEERDIATPFTVAYVNTIVNMLKTSMNLLLLKSGEDFVVNPNTPEDDIGGVWLDTAPMHDDVRLAPEARNEHKRRRRSAPLQDGATKNQSHQVKISGDNREINRSSRADGVSSLQLQNTLKKLERLLSEQMPRERRGGIKANKSKQNNTKRQSSEAISGIPAYNIVDNDGEEGNSGDRLDDNVGPIGSKPLHKNTPHDLEDENRTILTPSIVGKNETRPLIIPTMYDNNKQPITTNKAKLEHNDVKQHIIMNKSKHEMATPKQTDDEKSNQGEANKSSPIHLMNPSEPIDLQSGDEVVHGNDAKCENARRLLLVIQYFWTKSDKRYDFNSFCASIVKAIMSQISKTANSDVVNKIESELVGCVRLQVESMLPNGVAKLGPTITRHGSISPDKDMEHKTIRQNTFPSKQLGIQFMNPISNQREVSHAQNTMNYNSMGQTTQAVFLEKSQQRKMDGLSGAYCSRVLFNYYRSISDPYSAHGMLNPYQRQSQCFNACRFAANLIAKRSYVGKMENTCIDRLVANLGNCHCSELLNGLPQTSTPTDVPEGDDAMYNDDPGPKFNMRMSSSREMLFGRGKPILTMPQQQIPLSFRQVARSKLIPREKEIPKFLDPPRMSSTLNRIPAYIRTGQQKKQSGYPSSNNLQSNKNNNVIPFPRNTMQTQSGYVNFVKNLRESQSLMKYTPSSPINANLGSAKQMMVPMAMPGQQSSLYPPIPMSPVNNPPIPRDGRVPYRNYNPRVPYTVTGKGSESTIQFHNPLVILVTAPRK